MHHRGVITIAGTADNLVVTDSDGRRLSGASLARQPKRPRPPSHRGPGPRRARRLVVVRPLPTPAPTTNQLGRPPEPIITGTVPKPKQVKVWANSFAVPADVGTELS
ncbi:putative hNH endonuclease domain protein [Mycobacterium xenopi 4042]|uniref:Putative hNH endonuclease domain protein n=1 Tax=Mycobacterium xenopi 4042 TaxID=1299334 RepID=X8AP03_MYCXE|nr:putative hNH endonuclease domain protein [Mycobacterium xenopi 4042]